MPPLVSATAKAQSERLPAGSLCLLLPASLLPSTCTQLEPEEESADQDRKEGLYSLSLLQMCKLGPAQLWWRRSRAQETWGSLRSWRKQDTCWVHWSPWGCMWPWQGEAC